jgi:hypothetical protein
VKSVKSVKAGHTAANSEAAGIILASQAKYGGPESLMVQWAKAVIERAQPTIQGTLFKTAGKAA